MGEATGTTSGHPVGVRSMGQTRPARTFWWDREPSAEADVLRAVVFDADSALAESDDCVLDRDIAPRTGLIDSVMSLFVAGIWVSVVSTKPRARVETLVRQLIGDGLVETIVTVDDLPEADAGPACGVELYRLALWEMGITPRDALAIAGSSRGLRTSAAAGLPTVVVTADPHLAGAAETRTGYDDPAPLLAGGCQRTHRRWWIRQHAVPLTSRAASR